ncbi:tetratricopeptide (TPR) repeat protein [Dokdonella fugitiva]|uniref:Tetratricopeptide (TPR) repeat protein n=1 Tax=Dokdonella fugitiva TaxID=328517 RepID=A0A839F6U2_9GAMM|nr:hypothetical protein [Dokdonella fugitiva]MBA8889792.1 tetratricopeptide (TPR) repeat protein [Dokdonella fugitiva]
MPTLRAIAPTLVSAALFAASAVRAEPYVPTNDAQVIERLPGGTDARGDRAMRAMRALLARRPADLDVAVRFAQACVDRAKALSDPRPLGQAQAALSPWWDAPDPPVPVLLLRATIRQRSHAFEPALADLDRVVAREPSNAQAWLIRADVQLVSGDHDGARASCAHLEGIIATLCVAPIDGVDGASASAHASISVILDGPAITRDERLRAWASTLAAELDERLGRTADAEARYRASLAIDPFDAYTVAAYADFLLDEGRPQDVVALIAADTPVDNLLLRRAQAEHRLRSADAARSRAALAERFAALHARGDRVHLREEARYVLELKGDADAALELALENWSVQKEPLDARIALESALAAGRARDVVVIADWVVRTRLEGARIAELVRRVRAS